MSAVPPTSHGRLAVGVSQGLLVLGGGAEAGPDVLLWVQQDDVNLGAEQDHQAHHGGQAGGRRVQRIVTERLLATSTHSCFGVLTQCGASSMQCKKVFK